MLSDFHEVAVVNFVLLADSARMSWWEILAVSFLFGIGLSEESSALGCRAEREPAGGCELLLHALDAPLYGSVAQSCDPSDGGLGVAVVEQAQNADVELIDASLGLRHRTGVR
ncbi:hypothetical protein [Streptomyces sp. G45]|uniref:hypothetical protein n=1 Tax=Streptomyces sp. G45 TaxID=3406627 RepID=UPI003C1A09CD